MEKVAFVLELCHMCAFSVICGLKDITVKSFPALFLVLFPSTQFHKVLLGRLCNGNKLLEITFLLLNTAESTEVCLSLLAESDYPEWEFMIRQRLQH